MGQAQADVIARLRMERDGARSEAAELRVRLLHVEIELGGLKRLIADAIEASRQRPQPPLPQAPQAPQASDGRRLLRKSQVLEMVGCSTATIYQWMADGTFPQSVRLGPRSVAWREADIVAWQQSRRSSGRITPSTEAAPNQGAASRPRAPRAER